MPWQALDRTKPAEDDAESPQLSEAVKAKIRMFFDRYPTKRAALLPALHIVQETYGSVSHRAMRDIAQLLDLPPSDVLDTVSFYTHYWTKARGEKVIVSCRGLSCELMGAREVNEEIARQLGIGEHETTADGKYSFVTEECIGACEHGPCLLINEKLHKCVCAEKVAELLADPNNDKLDMPRSGIYDGADPGEPPADAPGPGDAAEGPEDKAGP